MNDQEIITYPRFLNTHQANQSSAGTPTSALLASQAAAAAMFNHQSASLFAAANIKNNSAAAASASAVTGRENMQQHRVTRVVMEKLLFNVPYNVLLDGGPLLHLP